MFIFNFWSAFSFIQSQKRICLLYISSGGIIKLSISFNPALSKGPPGNTLYNLNPNSFSKNELHLDELNDYLIAIKPEDGDFQTLNGSNENPLKAFSQIIKNNIGKKCNFYIYNKKIGAKDICVNIPNDQMFEMGCDVAFGKLHEFPFLSNEKKNYDEEKELKYDMDEK